MSETVIYKKELLIILNLCKYPKYNYQTVKVGARLGLCSHKEQHIIAKNILHIHVVHNKSEYRISQQASGSKFYDTANWIKYCSHKSSS